jgi:hypothetical protein
MHPRGDWECLDIGKRHRNHLPIGKVGITSTVDTLCLFTEAGTCLLPYYKPSLDFSPLRRNEEEPTPHNWYDAHAIIFDNASPPTGSLHVQARCQAQ